MVTATAARAAYDETYDPISAITGNPGTGKSAVTIGQFRLKNRWLGGAHSRSTIFRGGAYTRKTDTRPNGIFIESGVPEPASIDGDFSPHPVEFMLHGLAAGMTESVSREAKFRGVELRDIRSRIEAQFERSLLTGELKSVQQVQVKVLIDCDEPQNRVQEMFLSAVERMPAISLLGEGTPVIFGLVDESGLAA